MKRTDRNMDEAYPPIGDYALIGDCHSAALVSRAGSIDWCCLPRFDSDACFARMLDCDRGGYFSVTPAGPWTAEREYVPKSLILVTTFRHADGEARLIDFFAMRPGGRRHPRRELIRILEGVRGSVPLRIVFEPRLDFGEVKPWILRTGPSAHTAVGSDTGLVLFGDIDMELQDEHSLRTELRLQAGERRHLAMQFVAPHESVPSLREPKPAEELERHYTETLQWWHTWAAKISFGGTDAHGVMRSAIVLKALTHAPTGAIVAAPTTSLPEALGGERNWDYRFSWIRDSVFTVRALASLGCDAEADGFRRFIQRSAAGNADELQVAYAVDGKRRLTEIELTDLEGWRGSRPVRIGNAAAKQFQSDVYGLLLELSWRWSERGNSPGRDYWSFLSELVEAAIEKWSLPDYGIWEIRSEPRHFVHSKVMCWAAVDRGIALSRAHALPAPLERWRAARESMRKTIEAEGADARRGIFVQAFGSAAVDAALLLLPMVGFVAYDDERMMRTVEVIATELASDGLILRYRTEDGLHGDEGVFLACSFWLAECLARQGRRALAETFYARARGCANDLGLFSEEYDCTPGMLLGNFPQGLTHLAHIAAAIALYGDEQPKQEGPEAAPAPASGTS